MQVARPIAGFRKNSKLVIDTNDQVEDGDGILACIVWGEKKKAEIAEVSKADEDRWIVQSVGEAARLVEAGEVEVIYPVVAQIF